MRLPRFLIAASFAVAVAACASTGSGSGGSSGSSATLLTSLEIQKANVPTAYEAVDRLRRKWFRDITTDANVTVYMNGQKLDNGTAEALKTIPASDVIRLEYLKGTDAMMKFGQEAKGGAIIVYRK